MADGVGVDPFEIYQGEDFEWTWDVEDSTGNITDITGQDIELVIKAAAADPDPPLVGPITCTTPAAMQIKAIGNADLAPGTYVASARRMDAGHSWQYVHSPVTVLDSASID